MNDLTGNLNCPQSQHSHAVNHSWNCCPNQNYKLVMFATLALVLVQKRFDFYTCPIPGGWLTDLSTKDNRLRYTTWKEPSVNTCHTINHSEQLATVSHKPLHLLGNGDSEHPANISILVNILPLRQQCELTPHSNTVNILPTAYNTNERHVTGKPWNQIELQCTKVWVLERATVQTQNVMKRWQRSWGNM